MAMPTPIALGEVDEQVGGPGVDLLVPLRLDHLAVALVAVPVCMGRF